MTRSGGDVQGSRRLSRRTVLRGTLAIGAVAVGSSVLQACGPTAPPAGGASPAASGPKVARTPSGQLVFASRISELETLHPFQTRLARAQAVSYHINEGLTKLSADLSLVPGLAESWKVSDDKLTYTFALRKNVKWHDGQALSSKDVQFTLDAASNAASVSPAKVTLQTYMAKVEAQGESTIVITLKKPYGPLLTTLADQLLILPEHLLRANIIDPAFAKAPVGTGPYKLKDRQLSALTLEHNPDYWGEKPYTSRIILKDAPEAAAQQAGILAGEIDVAAFVPLSMPQLQAQGYPIFRGVANSVHGINLDLQSPALQDPKVRQALRVALDRGRIKQLHYTDGFLAHAVVPSGFDAYHAKDLAPVANGDAAAANKLLDEAGWARGADGVRAKGGQQLRFKHYAWTAKQWQDIATIAQASWKPLGVEVDIVVTENARIADTLSGRFDAAPIGWGLTSDPIVGLDLLFHSSDKTFKDGTTRNVFRYKNTQVDALLDEALASADQAKRAANAKQIQKIVYDEVPFIPIAYPSYELVGRKGVSLDETGKGALSSFGVGFFMTEWRAP